MNTQKNCIYSDGKNLVIQTFPEKHLLKDVQNLELIPLSAIHDQLKGSKENINALVKYIFEKTKFILSLEELKIKLLDEILKVSQKQFYVIYKSAAEQHLIIDKKKLPPAMQTIAKELQPITCRISNEYIGINCVYFSAQSFFLAFQNLSPKEKLLITNLEQEISYGDGESQLLSYGKIYPNMRELLETTDFI